MPRRYPGLTAELAEIGPCLLTVSSKIIWVGSAVYPGSSRLKSLCFNHQLWFIWRPSLVYRLPYLLTQMPLPKINNQAAFVPGTPFLAFIAIFFPLLVA